MEDWKKMALGDIAIKFFSGGTPSTKESSLWGGDIQWITSKWLNEMLYLSDGEKKISEKGLKNSATKLVKARSLILATRVGVGKVSINEIDLAINQDLLGIEIDEKNHSLEFLAYQLRSEKPQDFINLFKRGATIQGVTKDCIKSIELNIPLLPEQCKIAHVLNTVQKAIEQQDKLIRTTTELKKALMQKLFTEGIRGEPQKETEIGLVPESWEIKTFSEIFEIVKTQSHSRNKLTDEKTDTKILNIHYGDIHAKFKDNIVDLELEEIPYIIDEHVNENKNKFLRDGDIVIADASEDLIDIGKCIELKNVKNKNIIGGLHTIVARDKDNLIQNGFGAYIFKNKYVSNEIMLIATGLSVYGISKGNLLKMLMPIPPAQEQVEIAEIMDRCNKKIFYHQKKKQTLTDLFKTLLHELMTVQRRVHELEFEKIEEFQ